MPTNRSLPLARLGRLLGSLLPARRRRPGGTRRIRPWREDAQPLYPLATLTPTQARAYLQAADAGAPQMQFELFREMLRCWPRLAAVEQTRRLALTGLDWEIVPDGRTGERERNPAARFSNAGDTDDSQQDAAAAHADRVSAHCREALARLDRLPDVLNHLASAIGAGLAIAEIVWERGRIVDLVPVPHTRLIADPQAPWRVRIRTQDEPTDGIPLDAAPHKWIVHAPRAVTGRPFAAGLLRASTALFVAQHLSMRDWLVYSQVAGMPTRVAQFDPGLSQAEQDQVAAALQSLGTDAYATISRNVELTLLESTRSGQPPYPALQDYCNTEVTILWLGQHLTTDLRSSGSRAAAEVHDRVREDLLVQDIADEGATIRRDLLTPLVRARFGDGVPVPRFRRAIVQSVDTRTLADTLAVAVNQLGLRVPRRWLHQALGIPVPAAGEPVAMKGDKP